MDRVVDEERTLYDPVQILRVSPRQKPEGKKILRTCAGHFLTRLVQEVLRLVGVRAKSDSSVSL